MSKTNNKPTSPPITQAFDCKDLLADATALLNYLDLAIEGLNNVRHTTHYCDCLECGGFHMASEAMDTIYFTGICEIRARLSELNKS